MIETRDLCISVLHAGASRMSLFHIMADGCRGGPGVELVGVEEAERERWGHVRRAVGLCVEKDRPRVAMVARKKKRVARCP
jgi:hypothetical protein